MVMRDDLRAYLSRWLEVEKVVAEERAGASFELRWQQLNTAYAMGKGLGLLKEDPSELEVYKKWAKLKNRYLKEQPRC